MASALISAVLFVSSVTGLDVQDVSDDAVVALVQLLVDLAQLISCDHL